jgi:hypothetical protein
VLASTGCVVGLSLRMPLTPIGISLSPTDLEIDTANLHSEKVFFLTSKMYIKTNYPLWS